MLALLLLLSPADHAGWGLSQDFVVDSCAKKCVAPLERFRGRAQQTNGSAAVTIWKTGTNRIVAIALITKEGNEVIEKLDFNHVVFADFTTCPIEKDEPGKRIDNCVEAINNERFQRPKRAR